MYCTLCNIQRNLDGCIVRFGEQLCLYCKLQGESDHRSGSTPQRLKMSNNVTPTYQTKCDFQRNLDGCITPFASEARLDCKLQG